MRLVRQNLAKMTDGTHSCGLLTGINWGTACDPGIERFAVVPCRDHPGELLAFYLKPFSNRRVKPTRSGAVRDIWIKDDPEKTDHYQPEDEIIHLEVLGWHAICARPRPSPVEFIGFRIYLHDWRLLGDRSRCVPVMGKRPSSRPLSGLRPQAGRP